MERLVFLLTPLREGRPASGAESDLRYSFLLTPLREGRPSLRSSRSSSAGNFYSRPCGRGDSPDMPQMEIGDDISTHAPAGGATGGAMNGYVLTSISTHAPAGGATIGTSQSEGRRSNFYSRPCGRGDVLLLRARRTERKISTHAPAGGATRRVRHDGLRLGYFYSRPCGRGDAVRACWTTRGNHFYSRPCGRGDHGQGCGRSISAYFYSRPCGRGDVLHHRKQDLGSISTHAPAGGATRQCRLRHLGRTISTHAPAGGATAIFHKSVMRFCGKLPKDDTVLCLASFGFPRRDPKAVYLA